MPAINLNDRRRDVARDICRTYGVTLSVEALHAFANILVPMKVLRGHKLVNEGDVCDSMFYVDRGMVLQHYKKNNVTVTEHISHEGDMVICIESFFQRQPTRLMVHALETSVLYAIPYDKLQKLTEQSYEMCQLMFKFLERSLILSQQKADTLRFETAMERYVRTLRDHPDIIRRSPLHYVASYLQMTPETLSRVRAAYEANKE
jgi:CRP-like cAMP-binding protein